MSSRTATQTHRRSGIDFPIQPPESAIDPSEDAASIAATITLRDVFAVDAPQVATFFSALLDVLTGIGQRQ